MNKITTVLFGLSLIVSSVLVAPALTKADTCDPTNTKAAVTCGTTNGIGAPISPNPDQSINDTITTVIRILSVAVGIAAAIMLIIGGFRYVTSGGDATKVGAAKNTIIYALVGLVIVVLSQLIIKFVITQATKTTSGSASHLVLQEAQAATQFVSQGNDSTNNLDA